jgi:hypothetical protein
MPISSEVRSPQGINTNEPAAPSPRNLDSNAPTSLQRVFVFVFVTVLFFVVFVIVVVDRQRGLLAKQLL